MVSNLDIKKDKTSIGTALAITCFITNLSQLPTIVALGLSGTLSIIIWGVFIFYCFIMYRDWKIFNEFSPYLVSSVVFLLFILTMEVFSKNSYLNSGLVYPFFLSMFILFIANNIGENITQQDFSIISSAYIWSTLIVAFNIYFEFLLGVDISGKKYAYASKNSISQIVLTACILIFAFKVKKENKIIAFLYILSSIALFFILLLLKSRATIIAVPLLIIFIFIKLGKSVKNLRLIIIISVIVVALIFVFNPQIWDIFVNDIILAGRGAGDLNDASSGRVDEWTNFWNDMENAWLLGQGKQKRESIILTALLEFGFIVGVMVLAVALSPLVVTCLKRRLNTKLGAVTFCIALVYCSNGIFEQLSPFGPGVKCYFLWIMLGILFSKRDKRKEDV